VPFLWDNPPRPPLQKETRINSRKDEETIVCRVALRCKSIKPVGDWNRSEAPRSQGGGDSLVLDRRRIATLKKRKQRT
jgi:hypothetical protein